jgi:dCTP deaminase
MAGNPAFCRGSGRPNSVPGQACETAWSPRQIRARIGTEAMSSCHAACDGLTSGDAGRQRNSQYFGAYRDAAIPIKMRRVAVCRAMRKSGRSSVRAEKEAERELIDIMPILNDRWIRQMAHEHRMIEPFAEAQKRDNVISFGLSSYGYDARIANKFKVFTNLDAAIVDPKSFSPTSFVDRTSDVCIIPPNSFALGHTVEYFRIPRDVLVICLGKSTYARCGIIVNVTPLEPEWEGQVTIEISNTTPLPARIYAQEGICQFLFLQGSEACEASYKDKAGKYQGQTGVSLPRM